MKNRWKWTAVLCAAFVAATAAAPAAAEGDEGEGKGILIPFTVEETIKEKDLEPDVSIKLKWNAEEGDALSEALQLLREKGYQVPEGAYIIRVTPTEPAEPVEPDEAPQPGTDEYFVLTGLISSGEPANAKEEEENGQGEILAQSEVPVGSSIPSAARERLYGTFQSVESNEGGKLELTEVRTPVQLDNRIPVAVGRPLPVEVSQLTITSDSDGTTQVRYPESVGGKTVIRQTNVPGNVLLFSNMKVNQVNIEKPGTGKTIIFSDSVSCGNISVNGNRGGLVSVNGSFNELTASSGTTYVGSANGGTVNLISGHAQLILGENAGIHRLNTPSGTMSNVSTGSDGQIGSTGTYVDPNARALITPDDKKKSSEPVRVPVESAPPVIEEEPREEEEEEVG